MKLNIEIDTDSLSNKEELFHAVQPILEKWESSELQIGCMYFLYDQNSNQIGIVKTSFN